MFILCPLELAAAAEALAKVIEAFETDPVISSLARLHLIAVHTLIVGAAMKHLWKMWHS